MEEKRVYKEALFCCLAVALAAGWSGSASAGPISWSYQAQALGVSFPDPRTGSPSGGGPYVPSWSGSAFQGDASIDFDQFDPAVWHSAAGPQSTVLTGLNISGDVASPMVNFAFNTVIPGDYNLTLHLRDDASGQTGQLAFHGLFSGFINVGSALQHQFVGPMTGTLDLGEHVYTVALGPVKLPDTPFIQDGQSGFLPGGY